MLLGCYPRDEAGNPEIFSNAIIVTFMQYPAWVAWYAADPLKGIPREIKFRPSIEEVASFCYRIYSEHMGAKERAKALNAQIDDRKRLPSPEDFPEHRAKVVEKVVEQFGPKFGIEQPADKAVSIPPIETVMAKYPGGALKGLKLSDAAQNTLGMQNWRKSMEEAYADVEDDGDPD